MTLAPRILAGLTAFLALGSLVTACGKNPTPAPDNNSAVAQAASTRKPASGLLLPTTFQDWTAVTHPTPQPTQLGGSKATLQSSIYSDKTGQQTRVISLATSDDKDFAASQIKQLDQSQNIGESICGTPHQVPNAVSCIVVLNGGTLQTTATGANQTDLAQFTNALYTNLS